VLVVRSWKLFVTLESRHTSSNMMSSLHIAVRFSAAFLFLFAGFVWNTVMSGISMYRIRQGPGWIDGSAATDRNVTGVWGMVLPDLGFRVLPYIRPNVGTIMLYVIGVITLVRFVLDYRVVVKVFQRFICIEGIMLFMRGCTIVVTNMSNPYPGCYVSAKKITIFLLPVEMWISMSYYCCRVNMDDSIQISNIRLW
jgi:hypothetical protein